MLFKTHWTACNLRNYSTTAMVVNIGRVVSMIALLMKNAICGSLLKPHIIFMVADDMGWNDAGWNNQDIYSPNLFNLAMDGIRLNQSYLTPTCTASRSALMTGYYAFRTGMQHGVLSETNPYGLPLQFPTLADKLKDQGYATHIIGKWNLGFCSSNYTPTFRGFDTFFGFYSPTETYYTHTSYANGSDIEGSLAYDFRNGSNVAWEYKGIHSSVPFVKQAQHIIDTHNASTPLFLFLSFQYVHVPHEVPREYELIYSKSAVKNHYRRGFMARVSALDNDVGQILQALKSKDLYKDSVIIFSSDNGGATLSAGNNYPFRGGKGTLFEGGIRVPGFIHSPQLQKKQFAYNGLIHGVDWFETLTNLAGGKTDSLNDGYDIWSAVTSNTRSPREEVVPFMDYYGGQIRAALRVQNWKLITGRAGVPSLWYSPENVQGNAVHDFFETEPIAEDTTNSNTTLLFNLEDDPYETNDLSNVMPSKVEELKQHLDKYKKQMIPPLYKPSDPKGNPSFYGGTLSPGWCTPIIDPIVQ